ncbi:cyclophane-forming radical SAM peptide maturase AmcB [Actinoalloteichus spitiensis]|uniref:cyclophane-forming radical SAM peptide maturase AmcB n=1 Tax=Actinoalloteichus spitiensis TaxID=252394 RepID=UPI0009FF946F|nr:cyclophane-forming radical SAM peptide maturase AmcB [Actinoalloteichus spitiensis]
MPKPEEASANVFANKTRRPSIFLEPNTVILQPDTICNLDCDYCYLPFRKSRNSMSVNVARAVAASIRPWTDQATISVCWHGGEPLATGKSHLGCLMDCFADLNVHQEIQTNGTLIDDGWCDFFTERNVHVGVSIDGCHTDNAKRVDWRGTPAYSRIMRGIRLLADCGRDISVIAVVSDPSRLRARRLFDFVVENGISALAVNIEEREGANRENNFQDRASVASFWSELVLAWRKHPEVRVREISRVLGYIECVLNDRPIRRPTSIDPLPTVAYDGTVTLISPELSGFGRPHESFAVGNVLETPLEELIRQGSEAAWVREFARGVDACKRTCPYFDFCGGGHPSNRYFEHGRLDITETNYCRNSKIGLMEGVLHVAGDGNPRATGTRF